MTKEKFQTYLDIQEGGSTNMFNVNQVVILSGYNLTKEDCFDIMKNYGNYEKEYGINIH